MTLYSAIQEKVDRYDRNSERQYHQDIIKYYQSCIHNVEEVTQDKLKIFR